jgi:anti-sigma factor RsiW
MSDCEATRGQLLDSIKGRLEPARQQRIAEHLETCAGCRQLFERERALDRALAMRPKYALPDSLRVKLSAQLRPTKPKLPAARFARWAAILAPSLAAVLLAGFALRGWVAPNQALVTEAVNDHLRVLYAEHPIEIESGGIHQVKPWFTGRLDFAPAISFSGDEEFPLVGGAIGLFVDRKAATFVFKHRLHTITLFVFRAESLSFPVRSDSLVATLPATSASSRGFNVLLWRAGDLGYALVSDVEPAALARLAAKVASR